MDHFPDPIYAIIGCQVQIDFCLLSKNVGKVLTHTYITQNIWGRSWDNDVASLRVFNECSTTHEFFPVSVLYKYQHKIMLFEP